MAKTIVKTLFKTIKWLLITLFILIILVLALAWYLLATDSGYRKFPSLVNQFTPYTLSYDELDGHLFSKQHWQGLKLEGPAVHIVADELVMDLKAGELWDKHLHLHNLSLSDAKVVLLGEEQSKDKQPTSIPETLPQIDLPIDVTIDKITLTDVAVWQKNIQLTTISLAELNAKYTEQTLTLSTVAEFTQGNMQLNGDIKTADDYPLNLQGSGIIALAEGKEQSIILQADQSLLNPNVVMELNGMLESKLALYGDINLTEQILALQADWQATDYQGQYGSDGGSMTAKGSFDDITLTMQGNVTGDNLLPINLDAKTQITDKGIYDTHITTQLLGGDISFDGEAQFDPTLTWNGVLSINDIVAARYYEDIDGNIDGVITTTGQQTDDELNAGLMIESLTGQWQGAPIAGAGSVVYSDNTLNIDDVNLNLAGNLLTANGDMSEQTLGIDIKIDAQYLDRLLPNVTGGITGDVHLSDKVSNPIIAANVAWQNLVYTADNDETTANIAENDAKQAPLFESANGELSIDGPLADMKVAMQAQIAGADIPASDVMLTATVSPEQIHDIDLRVNTLEGEITATGEVTLSPQIQWALDADINNVHAGDYVEGLDGALTAKVNSEGSIVDGQVNTETTLSDLSGQWQGNALSGGAEVAMVDGQVAIKEMAITVGNNKVDVKGDLNPEALDVEFTLEGQALSAFHPDLDGSLSGEGRLTGTAQAPLAEMHLTGQNVRFQDSSVAAVQVDIDSSMVAGGAFNNHIELTNVDAAGQQWQQILLNTNGTYDQHSLDLQTNGGEVNINLAANGGFEAIDSWAGELQTFNLTGYDLDWRMAQQTQVAFSPERVRLEDFCMVDSYSNICVDVDKEETTAVNYRIDVLDPRSFAQFLPENMSIEPNVEGNGELVINAEGGINGNADITFTPGTLYYQPEDTAPVTLVLDRGKLVGDFSNNEANLDLDIAFRNAGVINGQARITNFAQPSVTGRLGVDIPDIGEFQYFIPKVSELRGNVNGELRFSGQLPEPQVTGEILLENGRVKIPEYATDLQDIRLRLSAVNTGQIDIDGNIGTPEGDLTTQGRLALSPVALNLSLNGQNMLIANSKEARVVVSPAIDVVIDPDTGVNVTGEVVIPEARIAIPDRSDAVQVSDDVVILTDDKTREDVVPIEQNSPVGANITIKLGHAVFFQTPQVKLRLIGGVDVIMLPGRAIKGRGVIEVESGIYVLYGQELDIRRGRITFTGDDIANPTVEVLALREIDDVEAGAQITGTAQNLVLTLTSEPTMPDSAVLSYLLFGRPPDVAMDNEALLQTAASISLGGVFPSDLAEQTGLDVFDLGVTGLKAGKYLGEDLYVGLRSNFFTAITQFVARYQFNDRLSAEATAQANENAIDFLYEFERD